MATETLWALKNISIDVPEGESLGIIGHNGAGKSTTLLTIVGAIKPTKGTIKFEGESIVGELVASLGGCSFAMVRQPILVAADSHEILHAGGDAGFLVRLELW